MKAGFPIFHLIFLVALKLLQFTNTWRQKFLPLVYRNYTTTLFFMFKDHIISFGHHLTTRAHVWGLFAMTNSLIQECSLGVSLALKDDLYSLFWDTLHYLAQVECIPISLLRLPKLSKLPFIFLPVDCLCGTQTIREYFFNGPYYKKL